MRITHSLALHLILPGNTMPIEQADFFILTHALIKKF